MTDKIEAKDVKNVEVKKAPASKPAAKALTLPALILPTLYFIMQPKVSMTQ